MTVRPHALPRLEWLASPNHSSRHGSRVNRVVVHRWGVKFHSMEAEQASYKGVLHYFQQPQSQVSAHVVYPGSAAPGEATQMVTWREKAWAEAHYNPDSVEVESADAIWLGHDPEGLQQLAHMVAFMLHHWELPPRMLAPATVATQRGFCRHADLGLLGGGHTSCPTTDLHLWHSFAAKVLAEYERGGFRESWGR